MNIRTISLCVTMLMVSSAACMPAPSTPRPTSDVDPTITRFEGYSRAQGAPQATLFNWRVADANRDELTCTFTLRGPLAESRSFSPCTSDDSILLTLPLEGSYSATLEVSDGTGPPVTETTALSVTPATTDTYDIDFRVNADVDPTLFAYFEQAAAIWERVIGRGLASEYLQIPGGIFDGVEAYDGLVDDLLIDVFIGPIDGPDRIIGKAGALGARTNTGLAFFGIMQFDEADLYSLAEDGRLLPTVLHEMGHVLGIGSSWLLKGYIDDIFFGAPKYNQPFGNAAYAELGGSGKIPLEGEGQVGTILVHFDDETFGDELMTGFLSEGENPMSILTIAALADIGYSVDFTQARPYVLPEFRNHQAPNVSNGVAIEDGIDHVHIDHVHIEHVSVADPVARLVFGNS